MRRRRGATGVVMFHTTAAGRDTPSISLRRPSIVRPRRTIDCLRKGLARDLRAAQHERARFRVFVRISNRWMGLRTWSTSQHPQGPQLEEEIALLCRPVVELGSCKYGVDRSATLGWY